MTGPVEPAEVVVVQRPGGWGVVEGGRLISRHAQREAAEKAALDWASRAFEHGRRLRVVLGQTS